MTARGRRIASIVFFVVLGLAAARDLSRLGNAAPWRQMYDFQDFYCAGQALDRGANPYTYEPLRSCEHRVGYEALFRDHPALVVPAPQPAYDFPPFEALATLDFRTAKALYAALLVLAAVLAAFALSRTGIPFDVAAIALALPVGYLELDAGQVVPFAFLSLALSGAALAARRDALAGTFGVLAAIEPHLGLPVALAVGLFAPRARIAAIGTACALAAIAVATVGPSVANAYLWQVLPAHALTELNFPYQYSLTYALRFFGVAPSVAQAAGDASYGALLVVGLWMAPKLARSLGRRDLLAFFPAAATIVGGPFLHMVDLCFAIPAALVLATRLTGTARAVSAAALCALTIPWILVWAMKKLFLTALFVCLLLLVRLQVAPGAIVAIGSCIAAAMYALELRSPNLAAPNAGAGRFAAGDLAQLAWRSFTDDLHATDPRWFLVKLPSWGALAALLAVAVARLRSAGRLDAAPKP